MTKPSLERIAKIRFRRAACRIYARDDLHSFDFDADVSTATQDRGKPGRYVRCWVWVHEAELVPGDTQ